MIPELVTRKGTKAVLIGNERIYPIPEYEMYYGATKNGRIYSFPRVDARGNRRNGKWVSLTPDNDGYLTVMFCVNSKRKKWRVHRLVAKTFIPNPNNLPVVCHRDNNKTNNAAYNLEWDTFEGNSSKAHAEGLIIIPRCDVTGRFLKKGVN